MHVVSEARSATHTWFGGTEENKKINFVTSEVSVGKFNFLPYMQLKTRREIRVYIYYR
jgi:hypothetical protein